MVRGRFEEDAMRPILRRLALAAAFALAPAAASTEDRDEAIARVEAYLNAITTLDSRFVQVDHDGATTTGAFQLKRPHFARIAYDDPPTLLIARGQKFMFWDGEIGQFHEGPVGASPASVLLHPEIRLEDAANVLHVGRDGNYLTVTMEPADEPGAWRLTLAFEEDPFGLRLWFVRDAQGHVTRVTLVDVVHGAALDDALFEFDPARTAKPE